MEPMVRRSGRLAGACARRLKAEHAGRAAPLVAGATLEFARWWLHSECRPPNGTPALVRPDTVVPEHGFLQEVGLLVLMQAETFDQVRRLEGKLGPARMIGRERTHAIDLF